MRLFASPPYLTRMPFRYVVYDLGSSATSSLIVPVLPMIPQYLLFWEKEPEDGFEAKTKVLFDHHVLDFLDLESLVFSAERMAERLVLLIKEAEAAGI